MLKRSEMPRTAFKRSAGPVPTKVPSQEPKRRSKKCSQCRTVYEPRSSWQKVCGAECGAAYAKAERERKEKQERQKRLIELKPAKWWKAKAKKAMHMFVRTRDEGKQCASCDTVLVKLGRVGGDYDAGHLRTVGSSKHLEFDERNVWGQCKYCNDRLHGNEREYERRLRIKMGDAYVDGLMADNTPRHFKIHDFQAIEAHYKAALKKLKEEA